MREISLYVHVPFCVRRCSYCTFYHVPHIVDYEAAFVDALIAELAVAAERIGESFQCPTVFFGGGTPSVLRDDSLEKIFSAINPFLSRAAEITFETNPEDVTDDLLVHLSAHGVNRLSLGVQSMNDHALITLKRCTAKTNARAIERVAKRFDNFSLDVLLGVPDGSLAALRRTLESLVAYQPPHFSVYCLEPGGVMDKDVSGFFDGVDPERSADEYLYVCERLKRLAYRHYEVSNFARPGFESRHNRVYWRGAEYLGIGPGAHSFIDGERLHNVASIERYIAEPPPATRCVERRGEDERLIEQMMLALRTSDGLPLTRLTSRRDVVDGMVADDLASIRDDRVILTDRGYLVLNEIVLRLSDAAAVTDRLVGDEPLNRGHS